MQYPCHFWFTSFTLHVGARFTCRPSVQQHHEHCGRPRCGDMGGNPRTALRALLKWTDGDEVPCRRTVALAMDQRGPQTYVLLPVNERAEPVIVASTLLLDLLADQD